MFNRNNELEGGLEPDLSERVDDTTAERGAVTPARRGKGGANKVFIALGAVAALAVALISMSNLLGGEKSSATDEEQYDVDRSSQIRNTRPKTFDLTLPEEPLPRTESATEMEPSGPPSPQPQEPSAESAFNLDFGEQTEGNISPTEPDRKLLGEVAFDLNTQRQSNNTPTDTRQTRPNKLSEQLTPSVNVSTVAHRRLDLTYLLRRGTNIGCTLDTKIVTTQPGLTRCIVSKDVYSANGNTLLIERGSHIIGEQTTSMLKGAARVFVLWTDVETPNGVSIQIDSPSAGPLGEAGQEAQVDKHFFERFGSAIMLSMISDTLEIVKDRASRNRSFQFDNASDTAEDIASIALRDSIDIPPTGYVNQGSLLNVMVARDVDFSSVYELVDPYPSLEHQRLQ